MGGGGGDTGTGTALAGEGRVVVVERLLVSGEGDAGKGTAFVGEGRGVVVEDEVVDDRGGDGGAEGGGGSRGIGRARLARGADAGEALAVGEEGARFGARSSSINSLAGGWGGCCCRGLGGGDGAGGSGGGGGGGSPGGGGGRESAAHRLMMLRARKACAFCMSAAWAAARARECSVRADGSFGAVGMPLPEGLGMARAGSRGIHVMEPSTWRRKA